MAAVLSRLTKTQIDHALERLNQATTARIDAELAPLGPKPELPDDGLSFADKMRFITEGKATIRRPMDTYGRLSDFFEYPMTAEYLAATAAVKDYERDSQAIHDRIEAEKQGVIDQLIMTNDGVRALELIAAFARGE